jgi:hypothetical protein
VLGARFGRLGSFERDYLRFFYSSESSLPRPKAQSARRPWKITENVGNFYEVHDRLCMLLWFIGQIKRSRTIDLSENAKVFCRARGERRLSISILATPISGTGLQDVPGKILLISLSSANFLVSSGHYGESRLYTWKMRRRIHERPAYAVRVGQSFRCKSSHH